MERSMPRKYASCFNMLPFPRETSSASSRIFAIERRTTMDKRPKQNDREIALRKYFEIVTREQTTILIVMIGAGVVFVLAGLSLLSSPDGTAMAWFCIVTGSGIAAVG